MKNFTIQIQSKINKIRHSPGPAGLWSRKSRHPTPTPRNFDYPTPAEPDLQLY